MTFLFLYPKTVSHFAATSGLVFIKTQFLLVTAFQDSFLLSAAWLIFLIAGDTTYHLAVLNPLSSDYRN